MDRHILRRLYTLADCAGERTAIVDASNHLTFEQLENAGARTATALLSVGLKAGDRIGLTARDGVGHLIELFAIWQIGAVAVPLDFRMGVRDLTRIVSDFDVSFLLLDRALDIPGAHVVQRDDHWKEQVRRARPADRNVPADDLDSTISLTSGTTGQPVGIVFSYRSLFERTHQSQRFAGGSERFAHCGLMSFSAIRHHVLAHLLEGSPVHFFQPLMSAGEFAERLLSENIKNTFVVPTIVRGLLAEAGERAAPLLPDMRCMWSGGADLSVEEKLGGQRNVTPGFLHCFSSSVTGTCSVLTRDDLARRPETDGRLAGNIVVEVLDAEGKPLPKGEVGHLRVRSPAMANRIIGPERENGDRLRDGWAYTGDLARVDPDNFLTICGRSSDMIIRGGANIYPAEVEHALALMPGLKECAVVGAASAREGQEIVVFAVVEPGISENDVLAYAERELVADKRPRKVILLDVLPRNANGKVLKRVLTEKIET